MGFKTKYSIPYVLQVFEIKGSVIEGLRQLVKGRISTGLWRRILDLGSGSEG